MKIDCVIIDDEPLARKGMEEFVRDVEFLRLTGQCENAYQAGQLLQKQAIDLIFLDIQMPKTSGIEFLKSLKAPPMAIITTAFPDYALEGFELDVVDYLVKPVSFDRFLKAATKAHDLHDLKHRPADDKNLPDYFFVKSNGRYECVHYQDITHAEAWQNYCIIHVDGKKLITHMTFGALEKQLPQKQFIKVHKSFIVSIAKVDSIHGNAIRIGAVEVPISRALKEDVVKKILGSDLLKRD